MPEFTYKIWTQKGFFTWCSIKIQCFGTGWMKHGEHLQLEIQIQLNTCSGSRVRYYLPVSVPVDLQSVVHPQEILSALTEKVAGVLLSKQAELLLCGHWCLIWEYPQQKHQNLQEIHTFLKSKHKTQLKLVGKFTNPLSRKIFRI